MSCSLATQALGRRGDQFRAVASFLFVGSGLIQKHLENFTEPERLVKRLCDMYHVVQERT